MNRDQPEWLALVRQKVETLHYGVVQIAVHDSRVTQIERTERTRFENRANDSNSHRPDTLEEPQPGGALHRTTGDRS